MKSLIIFLLVLVLSQMIFAEKKVKLESKLESKKINVIGESYNIDGKPELGAITYGVASNGGYSLKDESNYIQPEFVTKLPDTIPTPKPGPQEVAEEIPSVSDYYNGDSKLNKIQIVCKIYANPTDCVHQSSCGWCGASKSCIVGNNIGPLESCVKSSYIFASPAPNWTPQTNVIHENVGGVALTIISK